MYYPRMKYHANNSSCLQRVNPFFNVPCAGLHLDYLPRDLQRQNPDAKRANTFFHGIRVDLANSWLFHPTHVTSPLRRGIFQIGSVSHPLGARQIPRCHRNQRIRSRRRVVASTRYTHVRGEQCETKFLNRSLLVFEVVRGNMEALVHRNYNLPKTRTCFRTTISIRYARAP